MLACVDVGWAMPTLRGVAAEAVRARLMTKDIFISYRRHDSSFFAAKLRDRLEQTFPDQVFLDVSGIEVGDDFVEKLKGAVSSSRALIAVIGPRWALGSDGKAKLGEQGDFVTEEIAAAIAAGIAIVPVLIEGARMPATGELPAALQDLSKRNAVAISHERFDSDASHLIAALYKPLRIEPPGKLERILESAGVGASFSQRTRDRYAVFSLGAAGCGVLLAGLWAVVNRSDPLELMTPVTVSAIALLLGILGRNSMRRRWAAIGAILISGVTLVVSISLGVWRGVSLPVDPWFEASRIAQLHTNRPEIPPEKIAWSTRAPFMTPPPTVECACLALAEKPAGQRPYAAGAHVAFKNACTGPVTFVLSRSTVAELAVGPYAWFPASGREFAVITLGPEQAVRVPVGGTFGGVYQPWICQKDAPAVKP